MIESAVVLEAFEPSGWLPYYRSRRLHARHGEPQPNSLQVVPSEDAVVASVPIEESNAYMLSQEPMTFPLEAREDCRSILHQLLMAGHLDERGINRAAARLGLRAGISFDRARKAYHVLMEHDFVFRCRSHDWWLERTKPVYGSRLEQFMGLRPVTNPTA